MTQVSVCIPAWQAEGFIDRTLRCAVGQTHRDLRILVSVDRGSDGTARICRAHARDDPRIQVHVQERSLGWAGNVNFLLDRVESELFFLYFHDDVVRPGYVERLARTLEAQPEAVLAHGDLGHFGGSGRFAPGRALAGPAARRLMHYLVAPHRGVPLRGLTRTAALRGGLRVPTDAGGLFAAEAYLMRLLGEGSFAHRPETLYLRWDRRPGGVTEAWRRAGVDQVLPGLRAQARQVLGAIEATRPAAAERRVLVVLAGLRAMLRLRAVERRRGAVAPVAPREVHPAFADLRVPPDIEAYGADVARWARSQERRLLGRPPGPAHATAIP